MPASLTRNLITGGAGFLGSHLCDRLMEAGEEVICLDNYFTGRKQNIAHWIGNPRFELMLLNYILNFPFDRLLSLYV